ncbi:MAG TPA: hypothetical protein VFS05_13845 [Gemmatimonadaceae bacterium]|nr:hypothetical protein [Gemmatimonadaceae bacterium]
MKLALATCATLLAAPVSAAVAQRAFDPAPAGRISVDSLSRFLKPGMRLRLHAPTVARERIVGTIEEIRRDTIVIDTTDAASANRLFFPSTVVVERYRRVSVPLADVGAVEASRGRNKILGAMRGGIRGAFIAGALGGVAALSGNGGKGLRFRDFAAGFGEGAVIGFSIGVPFGYTRGLEQWVPRKILRRKSARETLAGSR